MDKKLSYAEKSHQWLTTNTERCSKWDYIGKTPKSGSTQNDLWNQENAYINGVSSIRSQGLWESERTNELLDVLEN